LAAQPSATGIQATLGSSNRLRPAARTHPCALSAGRVRDELLNIEEFTSLTVAQIVVEAWRIEYNTYRPHFLRDHLGSP